MPEPTPASSGGPVPAARWLHAPPPLRTPHRLLQETSSCLSPPTGELLLALASYRRAPPASRLLQESSSWLSPPTRELLLALASYRRAPPGSRLLQESSSWLSPPRGELLLAAAFALCSLAELSCCPAGCRNVVVHISARWPRDGPGMAQGWPRDGPSCDNMERGEAHRSHCTVATHMIYYTLHTAHCTLNTEHFTLHT